ncbi:glucosylceramidase [Belliella sp. DSM 107340]|uniref:Glucosylceramidase n=1 Tax=Belliella calami TaxID=2923436 RepID=A0ABS9US42_9BACT|nr:glycoside hydrolase family 30 beta sandwich domain-containing protein [Belliella calami]MCH7399440.1 glucosylceramidase [Belliella calami]
MNFSKKTFHPFLVLGLSLLLLVSCNKSNSENTKSIFADFVKFESKADQSILLTKAETKIDEKIATDGLTTIQIDASKTFQEMDGFGFTLTGGSAMLLQTKLDAKKRKEVLEELFSRKDDAVGINFLRISIGASDLDETVYSYADDSTNPNLEHFHLAYDTLYLIPTLKEILEINPKIKIMGSPWSAPSWMKTNDSQIGGKLKPEFYQTYASYFVKYLQAMDSHGIPIYAVTIQNEPEHPGNNPSMLMEAEEQAEFIKSNLGPAFVKEGIETKIIIYDHNCDHPEYPITVLNDAEAAKYIDGSAFHMYLGEIDAMSEVKNAHPDKNIYFTEQWTSAKGNFEDDLMWHMNTLIINGTRNWAKTVLEWNLAADEAQRPYTSDGGCTMCLGALTIGDNFVERNVAYYIVAHASKFIPSGSIRIESNMLENLPNVAFKTPDGETVLIVLNQNNDDQDFVIAFEDEQKIASVSGRSVASFKW